jgi:hypothetical protein
VLPALEADVEHETKLRVLVTPDRSGSCASNCQVIVGLAIALRRAYNAQYAENVNGVIDESDLREMGRDTDLVLYIGDSDGIESLEALSSNSPRTKVVLLDTSHHNNRGPKVVKRTANYIHIDGVNIGSADGIVDALRLW